MTTIIDAPATSRRSLLARNGTVELWSDTRGDGPTAVVLLAGAGCQAIQWEPAFTGPVVAAGHRVVRFDWRDVGRSSWLAPDDRTPTPFDMDHPASGKTAIARGLADELGWPIVAKDTIKSALRSALPEADVDTSRHVGRAAVMVLLAVASEIGEGAVLEAVWRHDQERDAVSRLPGPIVEVFCRCDRPTLEARYATRSRPSGYVPEHRDPSELWSSETFEPVAGGWPVIEVDTAGAVDFLALVDEVREALAYR